MNKQEFKKLDREQMIIAFNQLKDDYTNLFIKSVSKDKIKAKIKEYEEINMDVFTFEVAEDLKELLKEE